LYPNKIQKYICDNSFGIDRFVFNRALALKKSRYENHRENLSWIEISKMFTLMKKSEEYGFINIASRSVIEQSLQKLDRAYVNFFKHGSGFPKFKKKSSSEESFVLSDPSRIIGDQHISLPKLGSVKIRGLRKFDGKIKNVTVKRNKAGQYFATFSVADVKKTKRSHNKNTNENEKNDRVETRSIGLDVNLENFLTDSNGVRVENPRFKKLRLDKIKLYQRQLSKLIRKTSQKEYSGLPNVLNLNMNSKFPPLDDIGNKKSDFLHKLSYGYVKNHDIIRIEDLQISNMIKNHKLAESIASVSWGEFFRQLEYKSKWHGANFEKVVPNNTSKTCSNCGEINSFLKLSDRVWTCIGCKTEHVRDENAAKNILKKEAVKRTRKIKTGKGIVRKAGRGTLTQVAPDDSSKNAV
jgi:putative transposase